MVTFVLTICGVILSAGVNATCAWSFDNQCKRGFNSIGKSFSTLQSSMMICWLLWGLWGGYTLYEFRSYANKRSIEKPKTRIPFQEDIELTPTSAVDPGKIGMLPKKQQRQQDGDSIQKSNRVPNADSPPDSPRFNSRAGPHTHDGDETDDEPQIQQHDYTSNWTQFNSAPFSNPFGASARQDQGKGLFALHPGNDAASPSSFSSPFAGAAPTVGQISNNPFANPKRQLKLV